ncbi:hypothetical protein K0M31_001790 [Melipona bicolor]|uniref:Uncharacterized protein n=1 Tax=Melipona bicolor TaxID=60889 RepID=A0AA40GG87_9HYME|nr:hypothetical protein K0M31_001790 [Melipona bicolor]
MLMRTNISGELGVRVQLINRGLLFWISSEEEKSDCSTRDNSEEDYCSTRNNPRDNENFLGTPGIQIPDNYNDPVDTVSLFIGHDILNEICTETNRYYKQKNGNHCSRSSLGSWPILAEEEKTISNNTLLEPEESSDQEQQDPQEDDPYEYDEDIRPSSEGSPENEGFLDGNCPSSSRIPARCWGCTDCNGLHTPIFLLASSPTEPSCACVSCQ